MILPPSSRELTANEFELIDLARQVIDANTDAGPNENGVHTMGAAVRDHDGRTFTGINLSPSPADRAQSLSP